MAKTKTAYVCQNCGYESAKWYGKCPDCGQWNTMEEQLKSPAPMGGKTAQAAPLVTNLEVSTIDSISSAEEFADLQKQGGFTDSRFTAEHNHRALDDSPSQYPVQLRKIGMKPILLC